MLYIRILSTGEQEEKQTTYLAIKLNRLYHRNNRFESHGDL